MDAASLSDLVELVTKIAQGGGGAAMVIVLYIAWKSMQNLREAVELLRKINTGVADMREENRRDFNGFDRRLEEVADLQNESAKDIIRVQATLDGRASAHG